MPPWLPSDPRLSLSLCESQVGFCARSTLHARPRRGLRDHPATPGCSTRQGGGMVGMLSQRTLGGPQEGLGHLGQSLPTAQQADHRAETPASWLGTALSQESRRRAPCQPAAGCITGQAPWFFLALSLAHLRDPGRAASSAQRSASHSAHSCPTRVRA